MRYGIILISFFLPCMVFCQDMRTNEKGEKYIVYKDGTTHYFTENPDSPNNKRNLPNEGRGFPIYDGTVTPLDKPILITEQDLAHIAERRFQISEEAAKIALERKNEAIKKRDQLELEFQNAKPSDKNYDQLKIQLDAAKRIALETENEADQALHEVQDAESFAKGGDLATAFKNERKAIEERSRRLSEINTNIFTSTSFPLPFSEFYNGAIFEENKPLFPGSEDCPIAFDGRDEATGQRRIDIEEELLFTHTHEKLRPFLKDKPYMKCEGSMTSLGGFRYLVLEFSFAYPNAREAYGIIEKGSVLTIKLLNGQFVNLVSGILSEGSYNLQSEILTYRVQYPIDKGQISILKRNEVESLIVFWSNGFEEYDVCQMDFFIHQLNCLEN